MLARQAGLVAASPLVTGAVACAALIAVLAAGAVAFGALRSAVIAACDGGRATLQPHDALVAVIGLATPLLGATALAAVFAHLAQTRALWLPRRRIHGAPALDRGPAARTRSAAFDLAAASAIGAVAFGWLWFAAPRVAGLFDLDMAALPTSVAALGLSLVAALAVAWLALGILDALARHVELARSLAMTSAEKREDDRLAAADPRWARYRTTIARASTVPAIERAAVVLLGDDVAVAIAWDAHRTPIPTRLAAGRRARATQLLGLARRHGIAVHRDAALAAALADADGPVPERHWPRLAEIIAAVRR
jgi:flagellar biosynthesis protein FlhB